MRRFPLPILAGLLALSLSACSPSLSPLYRDYEIRPTETADTTLTVRIQEALQEAGWELGRPEAPNAVATEPQTISHWGLYKVVVSVEAVPIGSEHVRLFFHPYRQYVTGGRSKIPYLSKNLREQLLPEITAALEKRGLRAVGAPYKDDFASN